MLFDLDRKVGSAWDSIRVDGMQEIRKEAFPRCPDDRPSTWLETVSPCAGRALETNETKDKEKWYEDYFCKAEDSREEVVSD